MSALDLRWLSGTCPPPDGNDRRRVSDGLTSCPTVYLDAATGDVVVQGGILDLPAPTGEGAVRIPRQVLLDAAKLLEG